MIGRSLRVLVIAPVRFPIRQPFAGGLESALWNEVRLLVRRGHRVTLLAVEGSDFPTDDSATPRPRSRGRRRRPAERPSFALPALEWAPGDEPTDSTYPEGYLERVLGSMDEALGWVAAHADRFDVVSNHCLHGLPLRRAGDLGVPMVTTLHTPVLPDMLAGDRANTGPRSRYLAVSRHTAREWQGVGIPADVLHNGIDVDAWPAGPGGPGLVWFGRLVPEKGPHLAVAAARLLGLPLTLIGRIGDAEYVEREIRPHLGRGIRHLGPLSRPELAREIGRASCALATPLWEEPFGLVVPEALMCGTPVAGFAVGGIVEIARSAPGVALAPEGDVPALAQAVRRQLAHAARSPHYREQIRAGAVASFSLEGRMDALEGVLAELVAGRAVPAVEGIAPTRAPRRVSAS